MIAKNGQVVFVTQLKSARVWVPERKKRVDAGTLIPKLMYSRIRKGRKKNRINQRYGTAMTTPRPGIETFKDMLPPSRMGLPDDQSRSTTPELSRHQKYTSSSQVMSDKSRLTVLDSVTLILRPSCVCTM